MPQYSTTKPCPNCAKPIRRDATNCYFCGEVFDTVRCVACDHPIKIGSPACQVCGEEAPPPPVPKARPSGVPRAARTDEQECPECGEVVPLAAVVCKFCGEPLDSPTRKQRDEMRWGEGKDYKPHRGGTLLGMAFASLLCFPVVVAPLVAVLAVGDLKAMAAERMDPDGQGLTIAALVIAGLITVAVYSLLGLALLNGWVRW
jgi:hypothetical protein